MPTSVTLAKTKLSFSPYVESQVSTTVKSPELAALMLTGDFQYRISTVETNSKYKALESGQNEMIEVRGLENGTIIVDNKDVPAKNTTYYYLVNVTLMQNGNPVKEYAPVKLSVTVKNTLPKAKLQMSSISLDNAFIKQSVTNQVILTTGTGLWNVDALKDVNVKVMSGKKDVTSEKYFNIVYDGTKFTVSLNGKKTDNATLQAVKKGTYKIIITPDISSKGSRVISSKLAPLTLTVKVISSRPTVKVAAKATVIAGGEAVALTPTLKNNGTLTRFECTECTSKPKKSTSEDTTGIKFDVDSNGNILISAAENVMAGTYKYTLEPVTIIDGEEIVLDPIKISVIVKK